MNKKPETIFLSKQKYKEFEKELEILKLKLPAMIKETGEMAALGDRSENAGYQNAKALMRRTQRRIFYLERLLKQVKIIEKPSNEKVTIGSTVKLFNIKSNLEETYSIVDSIETDPFKGLISIKSPLAKSMVGLKPGQSFVFEINNHKTEYVIVNIH